MPFLKLLVSPIMAHLCKKGKHFKDKTQVKIR